MLGLHQEAGGLHAGRMFGASTATPVARAKARYEPCPESGRRREQEPVTDAEQREQKGEWHRLDPPRPPTGGRHVPGARCG